MGERDTEVFLPYEMGFGSMNEDRFRATGANVVINNHFAAGTDLRTIDQAANLIGQRVQRAMRRST